MKGKIILQASHINKIFRQPQEFRVLQDVNLEVNAGEFVSIVGKSGCGKSTLLYILSTMDTEYEGQLLIRQRELNGESQDQLASFRNAHLGFVFQFHFLLPEFNALKNVMMPALKLGKYPVDEIEHRAMEKLRLVEMEGHALKQASRLSGGQQQRVAIARALVNDPDIVMGDEPTGNLDRGNSERVFEIFRRISTENGQTIITVTHDQEFARRSDRIIEMSDGKMVTG